MMPSYGSSATTSLAVPHTQNTAPVLEFRCLFTSDLRRKQKRWQDGKLKFHTHNKRVMVYDERSNYVGDCHWRQDFQLGEGEELELERGGILVEVGECVGKTNQDLTELVDKRIKEKEDRAAAKAAKGTPLRAPAASIRTDGTPGPYPASKPLNTLLTPSGHYGRALVPTTSPFEQRQQPAGGNIEGKENEMPAKRQRLNDAPSKNGYAQNLMGATLSLSSTRPPSSAPIRYEPMKVKAISKPEAVDLTLDDDDEEETQKGVRRRGEDTEQRESKIKKRYKKSPPPKSTYAGNLTGASLNLTGPLARRDVGISKVKSVKPDRFIEADTSSEDNNPQPPKRAHSVSKSMAKGSRRHSFTLASSEEDIQPPKKTPNKSKTVSKGLKANKPESLLLVSSDESPEGEVQVPKKPQTASELVSKGPKSRKRDSLPLANSEEDVQLSKKPRMAKVTAKAPQPSKRDPLPLSRSSSALLPERTTSISKTSGEAPTSAARSYWADEFNSEQPMASLRIKSRPPRKMMMLMDRSSARTSSNPAEKVQVVTNTPSHMKRKINEIVLSQDTVQLNAFCQRQEARLQARFDSKQQPRHEPETSSSPLDSGINHQTIDMLLSRKNIQIVHNESASRPTPKPTGRKELPATFIKPTSKPRVMPSAISATNDLDLESSPLAINASTLQSTSKGDREPPQETLHQKSKTESLAKKLPDKVHPPVAPPSASPDLDDIAKKEGVVKEMPKASRDVDAIPNGTKILVAESELSNLTYQGNPPERPAVNEETQKSSSSTSLLVEPRAIAKSKSPNTRISGLKPISKTPERAKDYEVAVAGINRDFDLKQATDENPATTETAVLSTIQPAQVNSVTILDKQTTKVSSPKGAHESSSPLAEPCFPSEFLPSNASQRPISTAIFLPPYLNNAIQSATDHFRSIIKPSASHDTGIDFQIPEASPDAAALKQPAKSEVPPKKTFIKPSPNSSFLLPDDIPPSEPVPGPSTLELAESTPVITMTEIPAAPVSLPPISAKPPPQAVKAKVANPATTKAGKKSLQELAASTTNANDIFTPSSLLGSGSGSGLGMGFNVMPPPPASQVQVQVQAQVTSPFFSRASASGNNLATRIYPAAPPPRAAAAAVTSEQTGGVVGKDAKVLILGGGNGGGSEAKRENGKGVKEGPWSREAFDLFGEWVRPV